MPNNTSLKGIMYSKDRPRVLIAGLCRDAVGRVRRSLESLKLAFENECDVYFLVIESDSSDKTCEELEELERLWPRFRFVSHGDLRNRIQSRTARIAYCRNTYMSELEENALYKECDLLVVADLDGVNDELEAKSIGSCLIESDCWDACTPVQDGPYYDLYALRKKGWVETDVWNDVKRLRKMFIPRIFAEYICVYSRMRDLSFKRGCVRLIEVESAFGGIAIYKVAAIRGCRYHGLDVEGNSVCEHLSFNREFRQKGGRIVIDRMFVNCKLNEHSEHKSWKGLKRLIQAYYIDPLVRRIKTVEIKVKARLDCKEGRAELADSQKRQ